MREIDLSLLTVIGITTPGNNTAFLSGSIDILDGTFNEFNLFSSSDDIRGIRSVKSSDSEREKLL